MKNLEFFDANLTLGRPAIPKLRTQTDPCVMKSELAEVGISRGLVRHSLSLEWHPTQGNAEVSRILLDNPGFEPVWAVQPHWTGEFPSPDELIREMSRHRVRAAIMYPKTHGCPIRPTVTGPLLEALGARSVPLFLPFAEADLAVVETVAKAHPALPLIISDAHYSLLRELYAIFTACSNVYLETSGFMVHRGIEDVVERFGSGRLLFGSRYPAYNPGCAVAAVMYARIPDDAKVALAGGNIRNLLSEVELQ